MKLNATDISSRLAADFSGQLLFQPLAISDNDMQRPVVLLANVAQLLPVSTQLGTPVFDLLHHDPAMTAGTKR